MIKYDPEYIEEKKMKRAGIFLLIIFLASNFCLAQAHKGKGKVKGYVYDEEGNPIEGVGVKLFSQKAQSGFELKTNSQGRWLAMYIRSGMWDVDLFKVGYMPKKISMKINEYGKNPDIETTLIKVEGLLVTDELREAIRGGNVLFDEGKYEEAVQVFESILEETPDVYVINMNIGNAYFQMEDYDRAQEYYQKVLDKDPDNNDAMMNIGNCYANKGDDDKALAWYNKIEFENIKNSTVLYNIGTNFYKLSKYEEALKYYQKAVEIKEDFLDGIYQLGLTYLNLGNNTEAIAQFERYLDIDPDSAKAAQVKGFLDYLKK
jgi:tetratricopeptide (TPR) repeat protein